MLSCTKPLALRNVLLIAAAGVMSGCSSTAWVHGADMLLDAYANRNEPVYDESKVFATPSERLACIMDHRCTRPLSASQFYARPEARRELLLPGGEVVPEVKPMPDPWR